MTRFSNLSVRTKLAAIVLLTMGLVLVLATAGLTISETGSMRRTVLQELEALADVTGRNCVSPLRFNDVTAARETLSALQSKPSVIMARILTPAGGVFVTYERGAGSDPRREAGEHQATPADVARAIAENGYHAWNDRLVVVRKMTTVDEGLVGFIQVESSLDDLQATMRRFLLTAAAVAVSLFGVALVVAYPFQRVILQPLERLTEAMRRVSREKDYAIRVDRGSNDELGVLIDGFNEMLAQIEAGSQELQRHRDKLEGLVAARTAELARTNEQLVAASRHKSEFLANMSHELRTPLNAVIGFSEVLSERMFGDLNAKQAQYVEIILKQGHHLLSLINDILDLTKVEAGRMELELSSFSLHATLENVLVLFQDRARRQNIALTFDADPGLDEFVADERKIKQVVLNLLSNAVKFTGPGGRIDVSARLTGDWVQIAVKDTGIGIAPEDHEAIFAEFHQVSSGVARRREGTGLGLALARRFVELHGGTIDVTSRINEGSTFTCTLPIRSNQSSPLDHATV